MESKCKGTNCNANPSNGYRHSSECQFDHARAIASGIKRVEIGATVPEHFTYIIWRGKRIDLKESEVVAVSNPSGPSWVQQRFLDAAQRMDETTEGATRAAASRQTVSPQSNALADQLIRQAKALQTQLSLVELGTLPQEVMQTQRSESEWPGTIVDNAAIRQCMYRAEADFHKGSKEFLTKREQGHIMGLFRNVVAAFVANITKPKE